MKTTFPSTLVAGIVLISVCGAAHAYDLNSGLVAHYPLTTDATDASGNGMDGTVMSGVTFTNGSAVFDGTTNAWIDLPDRFDVFTNGFSFSGWVRYDSFSENYSRVFDFSQGVANNNLLLSHEGLTTTLNYDVRDGDGRWFTDFFQLGEWVNITLVHDTDQSIKVYRNGLLYGTNSAALPTSVLRTQNYIGRSPWAQDGYLNGALKDLRFYNRALGTAEVAALNPDVDMDGDGLSSQQELDNGTDPVKRDSDGDTITDYIEIHYLGTNPLLADSDSDGLADLLEMPEVIAWGYNISYAQALVPASATNAVAISAGGIYSLALLADGSVIGWGRDRYGLATIPASATNAVAIAAGGDHCLALLADGSVIGWGRNDYGKITIPASVTHAVAIVAGLEHSLALLADGSVIGWGRNDYGQTTIPASVTHAVAIAAGLEHSLVLLDDGSVIGWGETTIPSSVTNAVAISAGEFHSLALLADGSVIGWGSDFYGQAAVPASVTNAVAIAAGLRHSLALLADGSVVGWGDDFFGQATVPASATNAVAIVAGAYYSLTFSVTLDPLNPDSDSDGLLDGEEVNTYGTDPAKRDSDDDGISDTWEIGHSLNATNAVDAALDVDGDGANAYAEYVADTDPQNPNDLFLIEHMTLGSNNTFTFIGSPARFYTLYWSTNLANSTGWYPVQNQSSVPGIGPGTMLSDTNQLPACFYRVEVSVP